MRLTDECAWCSAPFDPAVSGIGEFCSVPCMEAAAEAVETVWSGEAAA